MDSPRKPRFTLGQMMVVVALVALELASLFHPVASIFAITALGVTFFASQMLGYKRLAGTCFLLSLPMSVLLLPFQVAVWVGSKSIPITVIVSDATTRMPIEQASVRLIDASLQTQTIEVRTDATGRAVLVNRYFASGQTGGCIAQGGVSFFCSGTWWLEVTASGHQSERALLVEYTGMVRDIHDATPPPIQIRLLPFNPASPDER